MRLLKFIVPFLILVGSLVGCAEIPQRRKMVLHPIYPEDIFLVPKGTTCGGNTTKKNGYFLSDEYVREVLDVGIELQ
jgi:hypothetical protein